MMKHKTPKASRSRYDAYEKTINLLDQALSELRMAPEDNHALEKIDRAIETSKADRPESAVLSRLLRICCTTQSTLCIKKYLDAHQVMDRNSPMWDGTHTHRAQHLDLRKLLSGGHIDALDLLIARGMPWSGFTIDFVDVIVHSQRAEQLSWFLSLPHDRLINHADIARVVRDAGPDLAPFLADHLVREVRGAGPEIKTRLRRALLRAQVDDCLKSSTVWLWIAAHEGIEIHANPASSTQLDIRDLVENTQSGHGRLRLLAAEPSLTGILRRCRFSFRLGEIQGFAADGIATRARNLL